VLTVGGTILLAGYTLVWKGWFLIHNVNNSLADLVVPGHYAKSHPGAGSTPANSPSAGQFPSGPPANSTPPGYGAGQGHGPSGVTG